jgi:hypothetical protein
MDPQATSPAGIGSGVTASDMVTDSSACAGPSELTETE